MLYFQGYILKALILFLRPFVANVLDLNGLNVCLLYLTFVADIVPLFLLSTSPLSTLRLTMIICWLIIVYANFSDKCNFSELALN